MTKAILFISATIFFGWTGQAGAQMLGGAYNTMPGRPSLPSNFNRATVSPFVGMRNSSNPGLTYFGLIRPQFALGNQIAQQRRNLQDVERRLSEKEEYNLPKTGHGAYFNTYSHFYRTGQ